MQHVVKESWWTWIRYIRYTNSAHTSNKFKLCISQVAFLVFYFQMHFSRFDCSGFCIFFMNVFRPGPWVFFFFCYSWAMSCHGLDGILFYSSVGSLKSVTRWLVQVRRTEDGFFYFMIFIHIIWSIFRWEVLILAEEFTVDLGSLRCGNWPPFFFVASIRCIRLKNACDTSAVVCLCMWNNTVIICSVVCG